MKKITLFLGVVGLIASLSITPTQAKAWRKSKAPEKLLSARTAHSLHFSTLTEETSLDLKLISVMKLLDGWA